MSTKSKLHLLLIEDNLGDAELVQEYLLESQVYLFQVTHCVRISEALKVLEKEKSMDIILSDVGLPDTTGINTFRKLHNAAINIPLVFMTGTIPDEEAAIQALKDGAQDYLVKGQFTPDLLLRSIRYAMERKKSDLEKIELIKKEQNTRKEIEEFAQAQAKLATIVAFSDDAIISKTLKGIITSWNKGAEKIFGYKQKEAIGKHITLIIPPELRYEEDKIISKIKKGEPIEHFDTIRLTKDGRRINISLTISPIKDSKGTIIGASKIARDITEQKKTEKMLQQQAGLLDLSYDAIFVWDFNGSITYWNKAAQEMYGYTKEEAIGKVSHRLLHTVNPQGLNTFKRELKRNKKWEGELFHKTKTGQRITVESKQILITDANGKEIVLETNRDVTQRKNTEENIRLLAEASKVLSSSLDYKTTLANVTKLAVPKFADWCSVDILEHNKVQQVAIAHKDPKQVKWARALRKVNPPDMTSPTGLPHALRSGETEFYPEITDEMLVKGARNKEELELARKLRFTSAMIVPLCIEDRCIGALSFVTTETKRHYTKEDVSIAEELAHRATLAIENARLYRNAQKAVTLRDDFISVASHELKTPITSLKMYTQVLQNKFAQRGETDLLKYFDKIDDQANKLSLLINDLLNVSKLQHGKLDFAIEPFDLNNIVKETTEALQETARQHTIIVEGKIPKQVHGDRYRIYQVITNLLTNAIKYSPKANKVVVQLIPEKKVAVVTVKDFGIGIEKEQQKKIFSQFYRVNTTDEKTFPGLGMGLFIAHEIVKRHGGEMRVMSEKGKGSQFSFTLPYTAT